MLDPDIVARMVGRRAEEGPLEDLTPRGVVLILMAEGRTNRAAEEIVVSERAVERHVTSIFSSSACPRAGRTTDGSSPCSPTCAASRQPRSSSSDAVAVPGRARSTAATPPSRTVYGGFSGSIPFSASRSSVPSMSSTVTADLGL